MKKLITSLFFAALLILCTVSLSFAEEEPEMITVKFQMPFGHKYIHLKDSNVYAPSNSIISENVLSVQFPKGHILTEEDVKPFEQHCNCEYDPHNICRVSFLKWDIDPVGLEVTDSNMYFIAVLNEDVCKVTVNTEPGEFHINNNRYDKFSFYVDRGYVITEDDVNNNMKRVYYTYNPNEERYANYTCVFGDFDREPLGAVINEDTEFTIHTRQILTVFYCVPTLDVENYPDGYKFYPEPQNEHDQGFCRVVEGDAYSRERLLDYSDPTMVDFYWDISDEELSSVTSNAAAHNQYYDGFYIYGAGTFRGDCTQDMSVNTADAVAVLQYLTDMHDFNEIQGLAADANHDGVVNTSDAVAVLQYVAGLIECLD